MGNKLQHERILDSAPEPREALDISSTDPTDSQILDDLAVQEILEEIDTDATTAMKVLAARTMVEEMIEGSTVLHHYQRKAVQVSWMQRLVRWARNLGR